MSIGSPVALWESPVSAEQAGIGSGSLAEPWVDTEALYWLEGLPSAAGRTGVLCLRGRKIVSLVPAPFNVRSRVNEYGGGAYAVTMDGLWFVNDLDQALCRVTNGRVERVIQAAGLAFGDLSWDPLRRRLIAVVEDRRGDSTLQRLVAVNSRGEIQVLGEGADFYAAPRVSPRGDEMVWLEWSMPHMPWESTRLVRSRFTAEGRLGSRHQVAGGDGESLAQPEWSPDGELWVVSDRSGWWNLWRMAGDELICVCRTPAECARPAFAFAQRLYGFTPEGGLFLAEAADGLWQCREGYRDGSAMAAQLERLSEVVGIHAGPAGTAVIAGGAEVPLGVYFRRRGKTSFRRVSVRREMDLDSAWFPPVEALDFPSASGARAHALYFPPTAPGRRSVRSRPVRVRCHGGPTSAASSALDPRTLFWTSRGIGVAELNYRGSTGYGRAYRESLKGAWGKADVEDALALAAVLAARREVDAARLGIAGGSAGGLTVLLALRGPSPYAVGTSLYGVADLLALMHDTHRFEAHYGEWLLGPWPGARQHYLDRSPLRHAQEITRPVIFLQGLDDPVVPPDQSASMARALAARGIPVALEIFPEERHGFRRPGTVVRALALELGFYLRVLDLASTESLPRLNLLAG